MGSKQNYLSDLEEGKGICSADLHMTGPTKAPAMLALPPSMAVGCHVLSVAWMRFSASAERALCSTCFLYQQSALICQLKWRLHFIAPSAEPKRDPDVRQDDGKSVGMTAKTAGSKKA
jgi:hypothetical protein